MAPPEQRDSIANQRVLKGDWSWTSPAGATLCGARRVRTHAASPSFREATRYREAGAALGFGRLGTFLNVTLPIGGRIALPSSINTYISVVKNTSLMYVIGYPELTTVALNINANTPYTLETFATLALTYLTVVWTLSSLIRVLEGRLALPKEGR